MLFPEFFASHYHHIGIAAGILGAIATGLAIRLIASA